MLNYLNVWPIVRDHFCPFRYGERRRFNIRYFTVFCVAPVLIAVACSFKGPRINAAYQSTLLAVFSVIAAVMMGLFPVVQNIVGLREHDRRYEEGEYPLFRQQIIRLQVLRELYANIAFVVLLLTLSLVPILLSQAVTIPAFLLRLMTVFVYYTAASTALTFIHVIAGIYLVLDLQAHEANKQLMNKAPQSARQDAERVA